MKTKYFSTLMLSALLFTACQSENMEEVAPSDELVSVSFDLGDALGVEDGVMTRAASTPTFDYYYIAVSPSAPSGDNISEGYAGYFTTLSGVSLTLPKGDYNFYISGYKSAGYTINWSTFNSALSQGQFTKVSTATAYAPAFADEKVDRYYGSTSQTISKNTVVSVDGKRFAYGINVNIEKPLEGKVTLSSTSPSFSYTVTSTGSAVTESNIFSLAGTDPATASKTTDVTMTLYDASDKVVATQTKTLTIARNHSKTLKVKALDPKATFEFTTSDGDMTNDGSVEYGKSNVLSGKFSVGKDKQVEFTKGNLYWDGSTYKFEANQTDYPTEWGKDDAAGKHVGHFFWTSSTDYKSGTASYMPYAAGCSYSSRSTGDDFFCSEKNPLTVEGTSGLFALSNDEWSYLISSRSNASSLHQYGVKVGSKANCLIIAPDSFTGTLKSSYTLDEVNSLGLVCLPAAGYRNGSSFSNVGNYGYCWSSTPYSGSLSFAYGLGFGSGGVARRDYSRGIGFSLRLVRLAQ